MKKNLLIFPAALLALAFTITAKAQVIYTFAGDHCTMFSGDGGPAASSKLYFPLGVAVDGAGNVFIADKGNDRIRKISTAGNITTVAGLGYGIFGGDGGPASAASMFQPNGLATDAAGNVYFADCGNNRVRKINHRRV